MTKIVLAAIAATLFASAAAVQAAEPNVRFDGAKFFAEQSSRSGY